MHDDQPSLLGSVGKLVRLAVFALVLALVVPHVKTYLFGNSIASEEVVVKTATLGPASKHPYHHQHRGVEEGERTRREDEVDVFNFSHQDYLASSTREQVAKKRRVASASPSAVIAKPPQSLERKSRSGTKASDSRKSNRYHDHDDDNQDDESQAESNHSSTTNTAASLLLRLLTTLPTALVTLVRFATIPFLHLFRLLVSLVTSTYHGFRFSLSHTLRPILHLLAPLSYLVSGILFIFVSIPYRLLTALATELYPVYIFLGAATVVGIAMGLASAAVLYLTAFVFVDRVPSEKSGKVYRQDEQRYHRVQSGDQRGYFDPRPSTDAYVHSGSSMYASPSPIGSPTTPYRPATRRNSLGYQAYASVPGSSLRASVG